MIFELEKADIPTWILMTQHSVNEPAMKVIIVVTTNTVLYKDTSQKCSTTRGCAVIFTDHKCSSEQHNFRIFAGCACKGSNDSTRLLLGFLLRMRLNYVIQTNNSQCTSLLQCELTFTKSDINCALFHLKNPASVLIVDPQ